MSELIHLPHLIKCVPLTIVVFTQKCPHSFSFGHVNFSRSVFKKHGFHLLQAMRFAVEEINNSSEPKPLLPGVKLGYQLYDICSASAAILATLDLLQHWTLVTSGTERDTDPNFNSSQGAVAMIGPDSSSKSFTPAALLGAYLVPQVSY